MPRCYSMTSIARQRSIVRSLHTDRRSTV